MLDIVMFCFGDKWQDWEKWGFPTRSAIIAKGLFESKKVRKMLIVNTPTSYLAGFYKYFLKPIETSGRKIVAHKGQLYFVEENGKAFIIEQLRCCPREQARYAFHFVNSLFHDNNLIDFLKNLSSSLQLKNTVLWLNGPLAARFIGKIGEKLVVYDAVDDWMNHPQLMPIRKAIKQNIAVIKEKADIVFAVSERLVKEFSKNSKSTGERIGKTFVEKTNRKTYLIPNGVNFNDFQIQGCDFWANRQAIVSEPQDLLNIKHPRVGYVGSMQERFDIKLFEDVVKQTPDISYIFVGPIFSTKHFEPLKRFPNIYFLGQKSRFYIPSYIQGFDVCIMPHVIDDFTMAMDPIKLYEYLAAGKPTICTPIPTLNSFKGVVEFAKDPDEFVNCIRKAIKENSKELSQKRVEFAKINSWSNRVENMLEIIADALSSKIS